MAKLSIERYRELLSYDPITGILTWNDDGGTKLFPHQKDDMAGIIDAQGYYKINIEKTSQSAHRIIWAMVTGAWPKKQIDHINLVRVDNRWINLREASNSQNSMNRKVQKNNKSGMKGVTTHGSGGFMARIQVKGKNYYLGIYKTVEEAKSVYDEKAKEFHKDFCRL